jgi:hypothetical protein
MVWWYTTSSELGKDILGVWNIERFFCAFFF